MMILIDTNILSTFGAIDALHLLFLVFEGEISITTNVFNEVKKAQKLGYAYAEKVLALVAQERLKMVSPTDEEAIFISQLPKSFGSGELDSVAIARYRKAILVTNEKRVLNYCHRLSIETMTLNSFLKFLWKQGILSKSDVEKLIEEIESKDKVVFDSKEGIFQQ